MTASNGSGATHLRHVTLDERQTGLTRILGPPPRHGERGSRLVDADHGSLRRDERRRQSRHVSEAGAEVQHAHARTETCRLKKQARGTVDRSGLPIEPCELLRLVAEHIRCRVSCSHRALSLTPNQYTLRREQMSWLRKTSEPAAA